METAKAWLNKLKSKDKVKSSKKKETTSNVKEGPKTAGGEEALSNVTKEKAAAAKLYIENHYKMQMQSLQERKERYGFVTYFSICHFLWYWQKFSIVPFLLHFMLLTCELPSISLTSFLVFTIHTDAKC